MLRLIIGGLLILIGVAGAGYIALWWGIVEPILTVAKAVDNEAWTATIIAWEVCKFFLKELFAGLWLFCFFTVGMLTFTSAKKY